MKKLIFGLLATVLFSGVSFAKNIQPKTAYTKVVNHIVNNNENIFDDINSVMWCRDFTIEVSIGVLSVSTNVRICCVPSPQGILCGPVSRPNNSGTVAYVAVNDLEPQLMNEIITKKLTEILIKKSSQGMIDNVNYKIKLGIQKIVNIDNVSYLELTLEKV